MRWNHRLPIPRTQVRAQVYWLRVWLGLAASAQAAEYLRYYESIATGQSFGEGAPSSTTDTLVELLTRLGPGAWRPGVWR